MNRMETKTPCAPTSGTSLSVSSECTLSRRAFTLAAAIAVPVLGSFASIPWGLPTGAEATAVLVGAGPLPRNDRITAALAWAR